jgi:hypothetical protein
MSHFFCGFPCPYCFSILLMPMGYRHSYLYLCLVFIALSGYTFRLGEVFHITSIQLCRSGLRFSPSFSFRSSGTDLTRLLLYSATIPTVLTLWVCALQDRNIPLQSLHRSTNIDSSSSDRPSTNLRTTVSAFSKKCLQTIQRHGFIPASGRTS